MLVTTMRLVSILPLPPIAVIAGGTAGVEAVARTLSRARAGSAARALHPDAVSGRAPPPASPRRRPPPPSPVPKSSRPAPDPHAAPRLHDTVRLTAEGLAKVLGDLETRVMQTVWRLARPVPAREVHAEICREHEVAPLTVITVLNKLVEKRLLARAKQEGLLHYRALVDQPTLVALASRRIAEGVLSLGQNAVATSLVDVLAERDPARLADLKRLIEARMREAEGPPRGEGGEGA